MAWFILISLLLLGMTLVLVEVLFIPGFTVAGVLGIVATGAGIYYAFQAFDPQTAIIVLIIAVSSNFVLIFIGFRAGVWKNVSLKDTMTSRSFDDRLLGLEVGQKGVTVSDFKPYGKVEIGDRIYEAKSAVGFLSPGTEVYIEKLENNRIIINKQ
ncbi:MAG TPA: NfeD family protein [Cyclobacteriaceae bacterium]|nr:NfeD family protein [Cyclobacteriaceae bacterium]